MEDTPEPLPPVALYLKRLVTVMAVVMLTGTIIVVALLINRLSADPLPLPERITLPDGVEAYSFTQGRDWFGVVTSDDQILIYDRATSDLRQTITLESP
ncbi:MAG: DUF6476 family protein [Pseudomonadota bacterium]